MQPDKAQDIFIVEIEEDGNWVMHYDYSPSLEKAKRLYSHAVDRFDEDIRIVHYGLVGVIKERTSGNRSLEEEKQRDRNNGTSE
jgi:hypothetical protein